MSTGLYFFAALGLFPVIVKLSGDIMEHFANRNEQRTAERIVAPSSDVR